MSGISNQIIDQFTHAPVIEHPELAAASLAIAGGLVLAQLGIHRKVQEKFTADIPNPALIDASVEEVHSQSRVGNRVTQSSWRRLGSTMLIMTGLGLAGAAWFGDAKIETTNDNSDAKTVFVVDGSLSMLHTKDVGSKQSRFEMVKNALGSVDDSGNAAFVEFAANNHLVEPMTADWQAAASELGTKNVDPNGGQLVSALELAASVLPRESSSATKKPANRGETVLVISDGTIEDTQEISGTTKDTEEALKEELSTLRLQNIQSKVIIAGKEKASYNLHDGSGNIDSGIDAHVFDGFGQKNIKVADTEKETIAAINTFTSKTGNTTKQDRWKLPFVIAASLFAGGLGWDYFQKAKRVV